MSERPRVVFVCVENSCRSQMAEAFAKLHGGANVEAHSAGSRPSGKVNARAARNSSAGNSFGSARPQSSCRPAATCGQASPQPIVTTAS